MIVIVVLGVLYGAFSLPGLFSERARLQSSTRGRLAAGLFVLGFSGLLARNFDFYALKMPSHEIALATLVFGGVAGLLTLVPATGRMGSVLVGLMALSRFGKAASEVLSALFSGGPVMGFVNAMPYVHALAQSAALLLWVLWFGIRRAPAQSGAPATPSAP